MTLEELLLDPLLVESLSDEQLTEITKHYWPQCRPSVAAQHKAEKKDIATKRVQNTPEAKEKANKIAIARALARQMGIKI